MLPHDYNISLSLGPNLSFLTREDTLNYNLSTGRREKVNHPLHADILYFCRGQQGQKLVLQELDRGFEVICDDEVAAVCEKGEGKIETGTVVEARVIEYSTGSRIDMFLISWRVGKLFKFKGIQSGTNICICEFELQLSEDIFSAEFHFERLYADRSDVRYLKGRMIENDRLLYDILLTQVHSVKSKQEHAIPMMFNQLFDFSHELPNQKTINHFHELGVQGADPLDRSEFMNVYQRPLVRKLVRSSRAHLIKKALTMPSAINPLEKHYKTAHKFMSYLIEPLLKEEIQELKGSDLRDEEQTEAKLCIIRDLSSIIMVAIEDCIREAERNRKFKGIQTYFQEESEYLSRLVGLRK